MINNYQRDTIFKNFKSFRNLSRDNELIAQKHRLFCINYKVFIMSENEIS